MTTESMRIRKAAAEAVQGAAHPSVASREEFDAQLSRLRTREKAHTRGRCNRRGETPIADGGG